VVSTGRVQRGASAGAAAPHDTTHATRAQAAHAPAHATRPTRDRRGAAHVPGTRTPVAATAVRMGTRDTNPPRCPRIYAPSSAADARGWSAPAPLSRYFG
jgi:hypothetical protein